MPIRLLLSCLLLCFISCTSLKVKPDKVVGYNNGIAVLQDKQLKSKIQIEIAQEVVGGFNNIPLIIYVVVENLQDDTIQFSPANISFKIGDKEIYPYDFYVTIRSNLNIGDALYEYGIETTPPNITISDPFFNSASYRLYSMPFMLDNGFFMAHRFYDYSFARANYMAQLESYNARKFLIANYLRKNTLHKNDVKGGFLLIPYSKLKLGDMYINVRVGDELYKFLVQLTQNK